MPLARNVGWTKLHARSILCFTAIQVFGKVAPSSRRNIYRTVADRTKLAARYHAKWER